MHFGATLQATQSKFMASAVAGSTSGGGTPSPSANPDCQAAVQWAIHVTDVVSSDLSILEQYVTWNIPKMEDGNNFGVTVQLAALKHVADVQERLSKGVDELLKHASQRADALEKCKQYSSSSKVTTTSRGTSQSQGGKDGNTNETKSGEEEKTTTTATNGPDAAERLQALVAIDCAFWYKAKVHVQALLTGYVAALDFLEKNATKIAQPKGSQSGGHFTSMY